ncbi:uncharacterized protein GIQ15_01377 [Arthroderma uncinatum]|uniref:uncharacterized protein n=1 Tax=Arthroderma uncinatum TaxID=74035 RepID=UPI00144AB2DA|nr:uncharacterized protein GIQ15_01377 [Arthroderma uncinatum]KAF3491860.1 hypothetical protein GIQ15_01377 [Arthroderma uncinatum]
MSPFLSDMRDGELQEYVPDLQCWESNEPRIDSQDPCRIGGPGFLPSWPVEMGCLRKLPDALSDRLTDIALTCLEEYDLDYHRVEIVQRYSRGQTPTPADNTVYISLYTPVNDDWVEALDSILSATEQLQFAGRVEMVYHEALDGIKTYPPDIPEQLAQDWPNIEGQITSQLAVLGVDWKVVMLAKRGYWEDDAVNTVVIKASVPSRTFAITTRNSILLAIRNARYGLKVEVVRSDFLWGSFSEAPSRGLESSSPGWPFADSHNSMGMSVGRVDTPFTSTIGGYLKFTDSKGRKEFLGVTCYHAVRQDPAGRVDSAIQRDGSNDLEIPCQSPSGPDLKAAAKYANRYIPISLRGVEALDEVSQETVKYDITVRDRQLDEIKSFNPHIGTVLATSGFKNASTHAGISSPLCLLDWAILHVRNGRRCHNYIGDINPSIPEWRRESQSVSGIADIPDTESTVIKKGRTTGVTLGVVGGPPVLVRLGAAYGNLYRRAWLVSRDWSKCFARPGDSGSWVLNMSGQVIGILVAGDESDGSGLIVPMSLVVRNIEAVAGFPEGSLDVDLHSR